MEHLSKRELGGILGNFGEGLRMWLFFGIRYSLKVGHLVIADLGIF